MTVKRLVIYKSILFAQYWWFVYNAKLLSHQPWYPSEPRSHGAGASWHPSLCWSRGTCHPPTVGWSTSDYTTGCRDNTVEPPIELCRAAGISHDTIGLTLTIELPPSYTTYRILGIVTHFGLEPEREREFPAGRSKNGKRE